MGRKRARLVVEIDLDPAPGCWGSDAESWRKWLEATLPAWYHPIVEIDSVKP